MNSTVMFSKESDEWQTPASTFDKLNEEFSFDIDAAASYSNRCGDLDYFGPDHPLSEQQDALTVEDWNAHGKTFWLNPPYSQCKEFIAKAARESRKGCTVVCLVPSRTDTKWWHEYVYDDTTNGPRTGVEFRFLKGRLKFALPNGTYIRKSLRNGPGSSPNNSAPFPSVIVIFRGY